MPMLLEDALLYSAASALPFVAGFLFRKRIAAWFGRLLFTMAIESVRERFVDFEEEDTPEGGKRLSVKLRPRGEALLSAVVVAFMAWAKKNVKLTLPGGLPEGASLGQALGPLIGGALKSYLPKDAKAFSGQIGAVIGEKLTPFLEGILGSVAKPKGKAEPNPFMREAGLEP